MASASPQPEEQEHDQLAESGGEEHEHEQDEAGAEGTAGAYPHYYGYPSSGSPSGAGEGAYPGAAYWQAGYIGIPMHMAAQHQVMPGSQNGKPKRKQVKNACTNCQTACKRCDDERPCGRCVKYSLGESCINSARKERKKGVKRGPYKKRKGEFEIHYLRHLLPTPCCSTHPGVVAFSN